jgi:hypothetical protein
MYRQDADGADFVMSVENKVQARLETSTVGTSSVVANSVLQNASNFVVIEQKISTLLITFKQALHASCMRFPFSKIHFLKISALTQRLSHNKLCTHSLFSL